MIPTIEPVAQLAAFAESILYLRVDDESTRRAWRGQFQKFGAVDDKIRRRSSGIETRQQSLEVRCQSPRQHANFDVPQLDPQNLLHSPLSISTSRAQETQKNRASTLRFPVRLRASCAEFLARRSVRMSFTNSSFSGAVSRVRRELSVSIQGPAKFSPGWALQHHA